MEKQPLRLIIFHQTANDGSQQSNLKIICPLTMPLPPLVSAVIASAVMPSPTSATERFCLGRKFTTKQNWILKNSTWAMITSKPMSNHY